MSKEFHVFTYKEPNHEQAVVFEVNRETDDTVELMDIYLVSTSKMGELKTKLNFQNIISQIVRTKGGNVDDNDVDTILDVFGDLISDEHRQEITTELEEKQTNIYTMSVGSLLMASELIAGLDPNTYTEMIEKLSKDQAS
jgi:hypothetical protein